MFVKYYTEGKWDWHRLVESGGMPSSHSALAMGLTTSVGLTRGFGDSLFAACLVFTAIVMYDASGVRLQAGRQAVALNQARARSTLLISPRPRRLLISPRPRRPASSGAAHRCVACPPPRNPQIISELPPEHPASAFERLKEAVGHTPLQVACGAVLGAATAYFTVVGAQAYAAAGMPAPGGGGSGGGASSALRVF